MGLTGGGQESHLLTSEQEPQLKYKYQFRLEAKQAGAFDNGESNAAVQSYINELLGVKDKPREKDRFPLA